MRASSIWRCSEALSAARISRVAERGAGDFDGAFGGGDLLAGGFDDGLRGLHARGVLVGLLLGSRAFLRQLAIALRVGLVLLELGLGAGQLCLRRRELAFGLRDTALGVDARLLLLKVDLRELRFENAYLFAGLVDAPFRATSTRALGLFAAGDRLFARKPDQQIARLDRRAFADGDLDDAPADVAGASWSHRLRCGR